MEDKTAFQRSVFTDILKGQSKSQITFYGLNFGLHTNTENKTQVKLSSKFQKILEEIMN